MTTSKLDTTNPFHPPTLDAEPTRLHLSENEVVIRRNGVEFLSPSPLPLWAEVTVDLRSPVAGRPLQGKGVVVDCTGNPNSGYVISLLLLDLSTQAQQRLQRLATASAS